MELTVTLACEADLDRICEIYAAARAFMAQNGNPTQWGDSYPAISMLREDIRERHLYVIRQGETIRGVFYLNQYEDPTYAAIYNGSWHCDEPYAVIHRIAADGSGGIVKCAVDFALTASPYLRIDTHQDNTVMQRVLQKIGFQFCGTIYVEDGTPRLAYDLKV